MVLLDRRLTIDEVANCLQISHGSAYEIMHNRLGFHKVCARWISKQLTMLHKQTRLDICQQNLSPSWTEPSLVTKHGSTITTRSVNGRLWNGNIHNRPSGKIQKPTINRKIDAYSFLGLIKPNTGTLSGEGLNNKQ